MGVSIHYSGTLDDVGRISELQHELGDISDSMGWKSHLFDDDWAAPPNAKLTFSKERAVIEGHLGLKGIQINPGDKMETLSFLFDSKGRLRTWLGMIDAGGDDQSGPVKDTISVKTQFADSSVHIWLTGLLKYIKNKYISDLRVEDEGGYWESGDAEALEAKLQFLNRKIKQLSADLSSAKFAHLKGLSADEIADNIAKWLQDRDGGQDTSHIVK